MTLLVLPDSYTDDSVATCKTCGGELGRWKDIRDKAVGEPSKIAKRTIRQALKGGETKL
jgi:hypothetical protein